MTKAEIKTLGDAVDDTAEVRHYGKTVIDFTLHPDQVQPAHIVIQRLGKFRADERTFGRGHRAYKPFTQEQKYRIRELYGSGVSTIELGRRYGRPPQCFYRILKEAQ